jgi:hypothetical protein
MDDAWLSLLKREVTVLAMNEVSRASTKRPLFVVHDRQS